MKDQSQPAILIVDDQMANLVAMEKVLSNLDAKLFTAQSGKEALALTLREDFALVLMDAQMPVMDGFETASLIRNNETTRGIPIVFVTAINKEEEYVFKGYEAGAVDYLFKPLNTQILRSKVNAFLELHRNKQEIRLLKELRATQEALKESDQRLLHTLDHMADGIVVLSADNKVHYLNPAAVQILDRSSSSLMGKEFPYLISTGETIEIEVPVKDSSGKIFAELSSEKTTWKNTPMFLVSIRNITQRKRFMEQALYAAKNKAVTQLALGVAHEFNNILACVQLGATLTKNKKEIPEDSKEYLNDMLSVSNRGMKLVQQLTSFSRNKNSESGPIDFNILLSSLESVLNQILGNRTTLKISYTETPLMVNADKESLEQLVIITTLNAKQAMPEGGEFSISLKPISLSASSQSPEEKVPSTNGKNEKEKSDSFSYLCLEIKDTGCGMSSETKERIFEPFFTTRDPDQGSGLGLSIAYNTISKLNGWVKVKSVKEKGSSFFFYIPLHTKDQILPISNGAQNYHTRILNEEELPSPRTSDSKNGEKKLLIIEDEAFIRKSLASVLTHNGFSIIEAKNGTEGLRIWDQNRHDINCILTDVNLPKMSGIEVATAIRARNANCQIVIMGGIPKDTQDFGELSENDFSFINKPFELSDLITVLQISQKEKTEQHPSLN